MPLKDQAAIVGVGSTPYYKRGESWPQAVESAALAGAFLALAVPGALLGGAWWFVAGRLCCTACVLAVRRAYLRRLLPGVSLARLAVRAGAPVGLACVPVLCLRAALWGGQRPVGQALVELALWGAGLVLATRRLESRLLRELRGYLRPGAAAAGAQG